MSTPPVRAPFRALTAVALADGHDAAIVAVNRALRRVGFEVVYIGFNKGVKSIVDASIQEDVDVVGLSSYNGGHLEFIEEMIRLQRERGSRIPIVAGGGGTITPSDVELLTAMGVADIFPPGISLPDIALRIEKLCAERRPALPTLASLSAKVAAGDTNAIARALTVADSPAPAGDASLRGEIESALPIHPGAPFAIGVSGNGGAGKSTLIDELTLRFVRDNPSGRVAILCCDPSASAPTPGHGEIGGALLGDRIRMLSADHERVFIRSLATRTEQGGVSASISRAVRVMKAAPFDLVILESAGIGQADAPFVGAVDLNLYVMTSEYGSPLQLEKTAMLERADIVAMNKCDNPASLAAMGAVKSRLRAEARADRPAAELFGVSAVVHKDPGMDKLYAAIAARLRDRRSVGAGR